MVDSRLLILVLLLQLFVSATTTIASANPFSLTKRLTQNSLPNQQLNIIEALASVLAVTASSAFPTTGATLFIPINQNGKQNFPLFRTTMDPTILAYHIVPQHLTFSDLRRLPIHSRLPTLLPNKSIEITNNSPSNFTIENCRITHPDVKISGPLAVHGIASIFPLDGFVDGLYESSSSVVDVNIDSGLKIRVKRMFGIWSVLGFSVLCLAFTVRVIHAVLHWRRAAFDTHRYA